VKHCPNQQNIAQHKQCAQKIIDFSNLLSSVAIICAGHFQTIACLSICMLPIRRAYTTTMSRIDKRMFADDRQNYINNFILLPTPHILVFAKLAGVVFKYRRCSQQRERYE
jgi:hypothetical protein